MYEQEIPFEVRASNEEGSEITIEPMKVRVLALVLYDMILI